MICACSSSDSLESCGSQIIVAKEKFNSTDDATPIDILNYSVDGYCITFELGFSGCDEMHDIDMVTDGLSTLTIPGGFHFTFIDNDPQDCEAYFTKRFEYDIAPAVEIISAGPTFLILYSDNSFNAEISRPL